MSQFIYVTTTPIEPLDLAYQVTVSPKTSWTTILTRIQASHIIVFEPAVVQHWHDEITAWYQTTQHLVYVLATPQQLSAWHLPTLLTATDVSATLAKLARIWPANPVIRYDFKQLQEQKNLLGPWQVQTYHLDCQNPTTQLAEQLPLQVQTCCFHLEIPDGTAFAMVETIHDVLLEKYGHELTCNFALSAQAPWQQADDQAKNGIKMTLLYTYS